MKRTSIITVNFHQKEVTTSFLRSVKAYTVPEQIELILVDNGSKEDMSAYFTDTYPALIYVRSEKNLGFAGGNNLGLKYATGDYCLFLNNDTEITERLVETLVSELDTHPEIGLLSPLILFFDDTSRIQYAGYTDMDYRTGRNKGVAFMETDHGQYDQVTMRTGFCHGAAMICRRADLRRTGGMDESYCLYYEELDWCDRFKRVGFQIGFTGKAKIVHKESISVGTNSPLKVYFITRNRWLYIRRNAGFFSVTFFTVYYLLVVWPKLSLAYLFRGRFDLLRAVWKGMLWNVTHAAHSKDLGIKLPD